MDGVKVSGWKYNFVTDGLENVQILTVWFYCGESWISINPLSFNKERSYALAILSALSRLSYNFDEIEFRRSMGPSNYSCRVIE